MPATPGESIGILVPGETIPDTLERALARLGQGVTSCALDCAVSDASLLYAEDDATLRRGLEVLGADARVLVLAPASVLDALPASAGPERFEILPWPVADVVLAQALRRLAAARDAISPSPDREPGALLLEALRRTDLAATWNWEPAAGDSEQGGADQLRIDQVHPADRDALLGLLRDALAHGERFSVACRMQPEDGDVHWVLLVGLPDPEPSRRGLRVSGFRVGITRHLLGDPSLEDARRQLQESLSAAHMCLWTYCAELDRYEISGPVQAVLGTHPRSLRELRALDHPDDSAWASYYFSSASSGRRALNMEYRIVRPDGEIRWVSVLGTQGPAGDQPPLLRGRLIDITERKEAELQNYELAERLGVALDAAGLSPWSVDLRTQQHVPGPRDVELFGRQILSREEFEEQVLPEDLPLVAALRDRNAIADGEVATADYRIRHTDGRVRWLSTRARCSFDVQGLPEKLVGVTFDITARKEAEAELRQSRLRLEETSQRLSQALAAARMTTLELDAMAVRRGDPITLRDALGDVVADDRAALVAALQQAESGSSTFDQTYRARDASGVLQWKQAVGRHERRPAGGARLVGVVIDVSQRRAAEAALSESQRWRDLAIEGAGMSVWEVDLETGQRKGSRMDARLFGFSPQHRSEVEALIHPDDREASAAAWAHSLQSGESYSVEMRIRAADGEDRWVAVHARPLNQELSGRRLMAGITMDIDDRKRAEREQQEALRLARKASEAKSAFLASMSHEIRTPLNAVIGFTGLLADSRLEPQQASYVQTLRSSAQLLLGLINDILDFSRIEAGELPIEEAPFSLSECVETSLDFVVPQAEAKGLTLAAVCEGELTRRVNGDVTRVRQVVVNLLSNAVKFTATGGVVCELSVHSRNGDARIQVRVRDTGIGMDDATLSRLFQPFQQGDASTTRRFGGTGLGLSICHRLVELMHGRIDVRSSPELGSEFLVELALPWADARAHEPPALRVQQVGVAVRAPLLREALRAQLGAFGLGATLLDCDSLDAQLGTADIDALVLDESLLARTESRENWPRCGLGEPLPLVVLIGLQDESAIGTGRFGQRVVRMARMLKPGALREALDAASPRDASDPPAWLQVEDATRRPPSETRVALRILIAEDNAVNQMLLRLQVEALGHRAQVVSSGIEALQAIEIDSFDVILMDVEMPGLDGIETARAIRTRPESEREQPWIVAVTAHATQDMRMRLQDAGMDDFVAKPVLRDALVAALGRVSGPRPTAPGG